MKAYEIFEKQWELYCKCGSRPAFKGERPKASVAFDIGVKVGQIRVFADMNRPFVALVVSSCDLSGWRIVPASPFAVPASTRERVVGDWVLQLWNTCTAARSFVRRSWIVGEVSPEDVESVLRDIPASHPGRIIAGDGAVAEYEREFLVAGGSFAPLMEARPASAAIRWRRPVWGIAAMFVLCLGFAWMFVKESNVDDRGRCYSDVACEVAETPCEVDMDLPCEMISPMEAPVPESKQVGPSAEEYRRYERPRMQQAERCKNKQRCAAPVIGHALCSQETSRYAEYSENSFHDPRVDALSTFSLDVDTASYTLMRRYLSEGTLPPSTSVRAEEFVNYFRYSYPPPKGEEPVAFDCELAACPWNPKSKLLRVGVQAKSIEEKKLPTSNLTFLIDTSGSMAWNGGMEMVKKSLKLLAEKIRPQDSVAIVTYANGTSVRLPSTPGSRKLEILAAIESLTASGGTDGGSGIRLAYEEAKKNFGRGKNNRVILVTDGDFNIGISSPKELEAFIAKRRESGVFLSVLGVGRGNFMDSNMKKLANAGNGNYAYLDSLLEAKKVMLTEFGSSFFTVAKDVKIQVEFNPERVAAYRLIGYENRLLAAKDFNDDKKDAGEIGSGYSMTAFYEIIPAGGKVPGGKTPDLKYQKRKDTGSKEMFSVKMRWKNPDGGKSLKSEKGFFADAITKPKASDDFVFASAVAEYALILSNSKYKGSASFQSVLRRARAAKGDDPEGYRSEFIRLVEKAELLKK